MAENTQTFILVGDFKDNITPSLRKLNTEVGALTKRFEKLSSKLRPISRDMAVMAESANKISESFKAQRGGIESSIRALSQYRKEAGKARAANEQLARSTRGVGGVGGGPRSPRGGGGTVPPAAGGGRGGGGNMAAMAGGFVAGEGLANMMSNAIKRGFDLGVGIMMKPFQYGAQAIGERIRDEMSDIKSAGGMFSVDRRNKMGIFKTFDDAMRYQELLNAKLAKSAAALPGETAEYVAQAKQLTDTIMISYSKNKEAFMKFGKELDPTVKSGQEAMATVLQKFTEKSVLLGQGEGGSSMYGVPQILEMLVSQDKINLGAFKRFGAYMRNPLLKNALEAAEGELKATGANTAERFRVIQKVLDQAVPNEVVMKMQNSAEGIYQAVKSAFLDPETGLLGLGRKLEIGLPRVDSLGRYLDKNNNVVATVGEAYKESASLFQVLRETVAGFILPATSILEILPQLYEPLSGLASGFIDLRNVSQEFYKAFNSYTSYFESQAKKFGNAAAKQLEAGNKPEYERLMAKSAAIAKRAKVGGFLSAVNNLLSAFGAIDENQFQANAKNLMGNIENLNVVDMLKTMFSQLLGSDFMRQVGEAIGSLVGGVLKAVGDLMAGVNDIAEAGPFAEGLSKGFQAAKGGEGISLIFKNLFGLIGKTLMTLFKSAPLEMSMLAALTVGMPILQGVITSGLIKLFAGLSLSGAGATIAGWLGAVGPALAALPGAIATAASAFAAAALPALAIAGAMLGLFAIFRHGDFIISSLWEALKMLGNGLTWLYQSFQIIMAQLVAGLFTFLSKLPLVGGKFKDAAAAANREAERISKDRVETEKKIAANAAKIKDNTDKSLARTKADIALINSKLGIGGKPGAPGAKPGAPGATPGKPGAPPAATPAATPAAAPAPVTIPPASLQPVVQAANAGATATQGVTTAVQAAKESATVQAATQSNKTTTLIAGINAVKSALMAISTKVSTQGTTLTQIATNTATTNTLLKSGGVKVKFEMGKGPGGGPGMVDQFTPIASSFGLQTTSGYRAGDPGYHGQNRARDYSNGTGPTPQMMDFAKLMVASYGPNLAELIYTPLGFSIKNGQQVPPMAAAGHYNHVHVAFGQGPGSPTAFSSASVAKSYESMMAPAGAKVMSVTANSSEFGRGGGPINLTQNVSIDGYGGDPEQLAIAVWSYTEKAIGRMQSNSFA